MNGLVLHKFQFHTFITLCNLISNDYLRPHYATERKRSSHYIPSP